MRVREYVSKSSMETFDMCPMQYFYQYNLGYRGEGSLKTDIGSAIHYVAESLALLKKAQQNGETKAVHDQLGDLEITDDWNTPRVLSDEEIDAINKSMINKGTYKDQFKFPYGSVRKGERFVNELLDRAQKICLDKYEPKPADLRDYRNYMWILLHQLDPRDQNVIDVEYEFDLPITEEWARIGDDYIRIKGFIDLITEEDGIYMIYDYKGLPVDTPIPTLNGWKTMGDLCVGDIIFDKDGKQTKVTNKSSRKFKKCYKITFDDGTHVTADYEHMWVLHSGVESQTEVLEIGDKISVAKSLDLTNGQIDINRDMVEPAKTGERTIISIVEVGELETQCITVDSPTSTYLCTEYLIPTHNSGQRKDWITGQDKTFAKIKKDMQLAMYYYVMKSLNPNKEILCNIFYIRDGGIFTVAFDHTNEEYVMENIKNHVLEVKAQTQPRLMDPTRQNFKCKNFCPAYKNSRFSDVCDCQFLSSKIAEIGIDEVQDKYNRKVFEV